MSLHTEWVQYGADGQYRGYAARMQGIEESLPAVIVIQEVWGADEHIQEVTRRYAQAGYAAFAPDLYARDGKRREELSEERIEEVKSFMESLPPSAWGDTAKRQEEIEKLPQDKQSRVVQTFQAMFGGVQSPDYIDQLTATSYFLRNVYEPSKGKGVAAVGFCMGGALSAQLACKDPELKAAVIYYGRSPKAEDLPGIACPLLGFYGELDPGISGTVPELAENMKQAGKSFEYHIYKGARHAFFNNTRSAYDPDAARDSFSRALALFNRVTGENGQEA